MDQPQVESLWRRDTQFGWTVDPEKYERPQETAKPDRREGRVILTA